MSATLLRSTKFSVISKYVTADSKKRIRLSNVSDHQAFTVYQNALGQIVLDPVEVVPAAEAWLWKNKTALASVKRGLKQAEESAGSDLGSFARHAKE